MEERKRQAKRKGCGQKGVWMEMLLLQPSVEPELCIGKLPNIGSALLRAHCSAAGHSWYLPSEPWESTVILTSLSSVLCQEMILKGMYQAFHFFLGSEKYLLP